MKATNYFRQRLIISLSILTSLFFSCSSDKKTDQENPLKDNDSTSLINSHAANGNEYAKGEDIYKRTCAACHQANGEGILSTFPPLANSDYLLADKKRAIVQIIKGSSGEIIVNGVKYNSTMPPQNLNNEDIVEVLNYVLHSWGNNGETITLEDVNSAQ